MESGGCSDKEDDILDPVISVENVMVPRLLFVDDLLEMTRSFLDANVGTVVNEIFEKKNRLGFKPSKCKIICANCTEDEVKLNDVVLEMVVEHIYLGTLIARKGRLSDLLKRIADCQGVLNEIAEICKTGGIGRIRLQFMSLLIDMCFKSKFKHGCEVWDEFSGKNSSTINTLIPNTIKRIMQMPRSTPGDAVMHDFGGFDLEWDVRVERVLLATQVMEMEDDRIAKKLFVKMYEKKVPGFCTQLDVDMDKLGVTLQEIMQEKEPRVALKKKVIQLQKTVLMERMVKCSKTDGMLLHLNYDGKCRPYLLDLPFEEPRIVFMFFLYNIKCNIYIGCEIDASND